MAQDSKEDEILVLCQVPQEKGHIIVDADEALQTTGCGRFQWSAQALITFLVFAFGYHCILSYFIASDPSWTCVTNSTSAFCEENHGKVFATHDEKFSARCTLGREEWKYTTHKKYSLVTEFDLVCGRASIAALTSSVFHVGGSVGIFIFGTLGDYLGRKHVLLVALSFLTVVSMACSFVCDAMQLTVLRFLVGATTIPCYAISYMYLSEFVAPAYRTIVVIVYSIGYVASEFSIDGLSYFVRYWRDIQLYASIPCLIGIALLFLLPQSPRWLLANGRQRDAERIMMQIAKCNGRSENQISLKPPNVTENQKYTYWDLVSNRKVALLTLPQLFVWFTTSMSFYTIAFQSSNLGGDIYQSFALSSLAEVPSKLIGYYVLNRLGRKKSTLVSLIFTNIFAASTILIPPSFAWRYLLNMVLMMFAKFHADIAVQGMYMWTFELYPTVIRGQGTALCIVFERLGSFSAPFLTSVLFQINPILPMVILFVFACAAAMFGVLLPETNNKPTREQYKDIFEKQW